MKTLTGSELEADAGRLLRCAVHAVTRIKGGGNNELFALDTDRGRFALKRYIVSRNDDRDRIGHEYDALSFLAEAGENAVPRPIAVDRTAQLAVYEWIDGVAIPVLTEADVDASLAFFTRLHAFRMSTAAVQLPSAVEACTDEGSVTDQIAGRLRRLDDVGAHEPHLAEFLAERFRPAFERLARAAGEIARVDRASSTLSPSDFGRHNMLRRADGSVTFLDFEYFGWDDPVKLVADAAWHPGSALSRESRDHLLLGARRIYSADRSYEQRYRLRAPLFILRWALIVLSEFIPERWERRRHAGESGEWAAVKERQLSKAMDFVRQSLRSLESDDC